MREIKFRAWDKSCDKMRGIKDIKDCFSIRSDGFVNENYILMQYTGFKDFDGKEIYEGDILEYVSFRRDENKRKEIVEFDEKCGGWYVHKQADALCNVLFEQHDEEWQKKQNFKPSPKHKVRVICNIYENPELTQTTS